MTTPRWTIRLRSALLFGALFLAAGVALVLVTDFLVVHALSFLGITRPTPPTVDVPAGRPTLPTPSVPAPDLQGQLERQRADDLHQFRMASGIALVLMTFASIGLAWVLAGRLLRPLRAITRTAREISARSLHQRLGVQGPSDEIKELADTFDELLNRLEHAFEAQRRFVANASHELRSPLTFERSLLEVALADPDADAAELRATCERLLANNQHQDTIIEALLVLARSQRGLERREDVDLAAMATGVLHAAGLSVDADLTPVVASGDATLIERLVRNLLDNAVRHNVDGGEVRLWVGDQGGRPAIRVSNTGPVVPPDQVDELFQPFRRLDAARLHDRDGLGLGLSIVAAIATAHDASLTTTPNPGGGLTVWVAFQPTA